MPPTLEEKAHIREFGARKVHCHTIYIPISSPEEWKNLLADPEKQWRTGYSARTLAHCWLASEGAPAELVSLFATSEIPALRRIHPLIVIPGHKVALPPLSGHPSQNDVFVLAKADDGALVSMTVEGKVSESLDKTVGEWIKPDSAGKQERLAFLADKLGIDQVPDQIRYQLLHRTVSAIMEAERFGARYAVMAVQSFSPSDEWFDDYARFLALFGVRSQIGQLVKLRQLGPITLFAGWARGDPRFLAA